MTARWTRLLAVAAAVWLLTTPLSTRARAQGTALAAGNHTLTVAHDGRTRSYILHLPARISTTPRPLVLAFHGGGSSAAQFQSYAGLDAIADREGVLIAYPNGSGVLPRRLLTWNAGECCGYAMNQRVDDVGFASAVVDDVARRTPVDPRRVYATGHSNGGMMAYRLGAARADRIAAIAPVAGSYVLDTFAPARPVAVLVIHSVDDPRAMYGGGLGPPFPGTDVRASHRPVMEGVARWRGFNRCTDQPRTAETRSRAAKGGTPAQTATLLVWDGCAPGGAVAHWRLTGTGHGWPGSAPISEAVSGPPTTLVNAAEEAWKFFAAIVHAS